MRRCGGEKVESLCHNQINKTILDNSHGHLPYLLTLFLPSFSPPFLPYFFLSSLPYFLPFFPPSLLSSFPPSFLTFFLLSFLLHHTTFFDYLHYSHLHQKYGLLLVLFFTKATQCYIQLHNKT